MSINLAEIRTGVKNYLNTKLVYYISQWTPATGGSIGPNEEFTFISTAINPAIAEAIALTNVRWYFAVGDPSVAKLIVPQSPMIARSGPTNYYNKLTANTKVNAMYLFPPNTYSNYLHVGDSDTISGLKAIAGTNPNGGNTDIYMRIIADVDMEYIFPKNEDTPSYTRHLIVTG